MTTVCWDGKTLAADRQCTFGTTPIPMSKIERIKWKGKPAIVGTAGIVRETDAVLNWIKTGKELPEVKEDSDFSVMIVNSDGVFYACNSMFFHRMGNVKWAIGSGCDYALGAMYAGKTAKEAIEIASQLDVNTGLGVETLTIKVK